nr:helicase-related protein [Micromonospora sp. DSM 115978]
STESADAYWTLLTYHNSLRELGKTITMAHDDIPERLQNLVPDREARRELDGDAVVELTSNVPGAQLNGILEKLRQRKGDPEAISLVASTNMISVGVDVPRLGLMVVVGQPKTTAEYIQATSRVGRTRERPGLVVTLYSPSKPRDRSHYESFVPYHATLYRSVEPSSVTPFSVPARSRALHAGIVLLARHAKGWAADDDAARFDRTDPDFCAIIDALLARAERADPDEAERVRLDVETYLQEWESWVNEADLSGGLRYRRTARSKSPALLRRFTDRPPGWPT